MRRDLFFSGRQPYNVLVRGNVLLHREAAERIAERLAPLAETAGAPLRLLDLACGGIPLTPVEVMESFPETRFDYTGIDINDEQVACAARFAHARNVVSARVLRGSAWDLDGQELEGRFDLVYVGLNWHHGTPEEIARLAGQVRGRLAPGGLLINHDCYRPDDTPYVRRPEPPAPAGGDAAARRAHAPSPSGDSGAGSTPSATAPTGPAWKADLIDRLQRGFIAAGGDAEGAETMATHSWACDFPLSTAEVGGVLEGAGLRVEIVRYPSSGSPVAPYLALVVAAAP